MLKRKSKSLARGLAMTRRWMNHGLITAARQREYEQLFGPFPERLPAEVIQRIRRKADADEIALARCCNTAPPHVRQWEQGRGHPRGPELKLIHLAGKRGVHIVSQGATP